MSMVDLRMLQVKAWISQLLNSVGGIQFYIDNCNSLLLLCPGCDCSGTGTMPSIGALPVELTQSIQVCAIPSVNAT